METLKVSCSGQAGDIIYTLPALKAYSEQNDCKVDYYLTYDRRPMHWMADHPYGLNLLPLNVANMLTPLLLKQAYINEVHLVSAEQFKDSDVQYNLDDMRECPIDFAKGNISDWYVFLFNEFYKEEVKIDAEPFLISDKSEWAKDYIGVTRTARYNNKDLDYSIFKDVDNILFFGLPAEYKVFSEICPDSIYHPVKNFLELAEMVKGLKAFFSNQTLNFAIAEGLKTNRYLEVCPTAPNVKVIGENGHEIITQKDLIDAVNSIGNGGSSAEGSRQDGGTTVCN